MIVTDLETLRSKSENYDPKKHSLDDIIMCLEENLEVSKIKGVGLSAIQVGLPLKICIVRTEKLSLNLYNAEITKASEMITFKGEGCLSIPNVYLDTKRMNKITVKNGNGEEHSLEGFEAIVVQHELDHFEGILIIDREVTK